MFRSFLSLVIHHLAIFDVLIQGGFWFIPKIRIGNLCKPFYDVIMIPFWMLFLNLQTLDQNLNAKIYKILQKFEYLDKTEENLSISRTERVFKVK